MGGGEVRGGLNRFYWATTLALSSAIVESAWRVS